MYKRTHEAVETPNQFAPDTITEVHSEDLSSRMEELNRKGVRTLIVHVDGGWEDNRTPSHYSLKTLDALVLQSALSASSEPRVATIPNPLKQWMKQLKKLDISQLEHFANVKEVFNTFPKQPLDELKVGSFGLLALLEFSTLNNQRDILFSIQSIHCTFNSMFTVHALSWLWEWAMYKNDRRERSLTMIFPRWDMNHHIKMRAFVQRQSVAPIPHVKNLHLLDVRILNVDNVTENDENRAKVVYTCPFVWFQGFNTCTHFFVRVKNMDVLTANWLDIITMPIPLVLADTKMSVDLIFTRTWSGFHDATRDVRSVQDTINQLVSRHIIKWERLVLPPNYYKHQKMYDENNMMEAKRLGIETKMTLTLHAPAHHIPVVSQFVDITMDHHKKQHLYDQFLKNGDIKYVIKSSS